MRFVSSASLFLLPLLASAIPFPSLEARSTTLFGFDVDTFATRSLSVAFQTMEGIVNAGLAQAKSSDPGLSVLQSISQQSIFNTVKNAIDLKCSINLLDVTSGNFNTPRSLAFAAHYASVIVMGNTAMLENSSMVFSDDTRNLLQQAVDVAGQITSAAAAVAFPGTDLFHLPLMTVVEYIASVVSTNITTCTDSKGASLPIPEVGITDLLLGQAFNTAVNHQIGVGLPCPNPNGCFCQSLVTNANGTSVVVSPVSNCVTASQEGVSILFVTTSSTPLSSHPADRALQQSSVISATELFLVGDQQLV